MMARSEDKAPAGVQDPARVAGARYVFVLLGTLSVLLATVLALNLLLGERSLGSREIVKAASDWQQATRGITYAPPMTANRPFKILRLHDRLPEVNALVFGASSSMGITQSAFPEAIRIYNFAQTANPPHATIPEAEYVVQHFGGRVHWLFIPLDWALGMVYLPGEPQPIDLSREAVLSGDALPQVPLLKRIQDAVSWPRVKNLSELLGGVARADQPAAALREVFLGGGEADYRCPDGTQARDFDTINRGICAGFRYDGSATFTDGSRVDPSRAEQLVRAAAASSSKYAQALARTGGEPNRVLLDRLAGLAARFGRQGGRVVVFLPPLIPGLERALAESAYGGAALARTKQALDDWARRSHIAILDAGASERFGCTAGEFLDEHHAFPECYDKVFRSFWQADSGVVRSGLWPGG